MYRPPHLHQVVVDAVVLGQHHLHVVPLLLHSAPQRRHHIAQPALLLGVRTMGGGEGAQWQCVRCVYVCVGKWVRGIKPQGNGQPAMIFSSCC
jgi:hypothetical protein